jgi:hypothetical protein
MAAARSCCWRRKCLQTGTFPVLRDQCGNYVETGGRLGQSRQRKMPICRLFSTGATGLEPATSGVTRPSRAQRRPRTNTSERRHLQALFAVGLSRLRMVEPIVKPTFGPRAGHELESGQTTFCRESSIAPPPSRPRAEIGGGLASLRAGVVAPAGPPHPTLVIGVPGSSPGVGLAQTSGLRV